MITIVIYSSKNKYCCLKTCINMCENCFQIDNPTLNVYFQRFRKKQFIFSSRKKLALFTSKSQPFYGLESCRYPVFLSTKCFLIGILVRHMRMHTGEKREKPYKCYICSYSCAHKNSLVSHMRIHTRDKPYKCDVCSKNSSKNKYCCLKTCINMCEKCFQIDS